MAEGIVRQMASIGLEVEAKRTGDQVFKRMVFDEKSYELALVYCDGFDNLYSDMGRWYRSDGDLNVTGVSDRELDSLFDRWDSEVVTAKWVDLTLALNERISAIAPAMYLCSLEKDVYTRGLGNVAIATDNPFLSVENWTLRNSGMRLLRFFAREFFVHGIVFALAGTCALALLYLASIGAPIESYAETARSFVLLVTGLTTSRRRIRFQRRADNRERGGGNPAARPRCRSRSLPSSRFPFPRRRARRGTSRTVTVRGAPWASTPRSTWQYPRSPPVRSSWAFGPSRRRSAARRRSCS
jgi:hypothetical protein